MFNQIKETTDVYKKVLDGLSTRQHVFANNLANVDTPNFKRSEVTFEEQLSRSILQQKGDAFPGIPISYTNPLHFSLDDYTPYIQPDVIIDKNTTYRNDGNNVDIDLEMTKLAKNEVAYSAVSQLLAGKISGLKYVIGEGGG